MEKLELKELKGSIIIGIIALCFVLIPLGGLTFELLKFSDYFAKSCHLEYNILITMMIIGIKDSLFLIFRLLIKLFSPQILVLDSQNFYSSELKNFIEWGKIDSIEYLDYKKSFINKTNLLSYALYMFITTHTIGTIVEFIKKVLLSDLETSKIIIIQTQYKKELLKKSSFLTKFTNLFLPKNIIKLDFDISLATCDDNKPIDFLPQAKKFNLSKNNS